MASFIQQYKNKTKKQNKQHTQNKKSSAISDIQLWQKDPSPQLTQRVLGLIKPTIQSALHTYVPGQEADYRIKATGYALNSLKNYNSAKKVSPNTYIFSQLRRLSRIKRQRQNIVHIPQSQIYQQAQVNKALQQFQDMYDRQPTDQQLADKLHVSKAKLAKMLQGNKRSVIPDSSAINPITGQSTFSQNAITQKDYFDYVYRSVSPQDKLIMQYTSGFGKPVLSNNQIAAKLKLSPGAVSQHKARLQAMLAQVRGLL